MWVRVKDRDTGHQYDVNDGAFDPDAHVKVNAPKRWPDLPDSERPRPALTHAQLGDTDDPADDGAGDTAGSTGETEENR